MAGPSGPRPDWRSRSRNSDLPCHFTDLSEGLHLSFTDVHEQCSRMTCSCMRITRKLQFVPKHAMERVCTSLRSSHSIPERRCPRANDHSTTSSLAVFNDTFRRITGHIAWLIARYSIASFVAVSCAGQILVGWLIPQSHATHPMVEVAWSTGS